MSFREPVSISLDEGVAVVTIDTVCGHNAAAACVDELKREISVQKVVLESDPQPDATSDDSEAHGKYHGISSLLVRESLLLGKLTSSCTRQLVSCQLTVLAL